MRNVSTRAALAFAAVVGGSALLHISNPVVAVTGNPPPDRMECQCDEPARPGKAATTQTSVPPPVTHTCEMSQGTVTITTEEGSGSAGTKGIKVSCTYTEVSGMPYRELFDSLEPGECFGVRNSPVTWYFKDYHGDHGSSCKTVTQWPCPDFPWVAPCRWLECWDLQNVEPQTYENWIGATSDCSMRPAQ